MCPTILIVEDERLIALDIKRRLVQLGYEVAAIASHAQAVFDAIAQQLPDLVLMDICLQGEQTGIAVATQVREQYNLPVVFLTAHADEATLAQAKATQPFGYLVKPVDLRELSTTIEIAIARHQAEVTLQKAIDQERKVNELKSWFISAVSHEFRNPLSALQFTLDLLEFGDQQVSPEKRQIFVQRGRMAIKDMTQLLEEVLLIGEAEAGNLVCNPIPVDIRSFCCDLVEGLQSHVGSAHSLIFRFSELKKGSNDPLYFLDVKLLRHILTNLLSNAIKYSPLGSEVYFDLICYLDTVVFRIEDRGIGIPESDRALLFEPFYRCSNVNQIPGTGLGLSIVKQCVEAHGGQIAVESTVGRGTVMTVTLKMSGEVLAVMDQVNCQFRKM